MKRVSLAWRDLAVFEPGDAAAAASATEGAAAESGGLQQQQRRGLVDWGQVEELDLSHNRLRGAGFLRALPRLRVLVLDANAVDGASSAWPAAPALETLSLNNNAVSAAALPALAAALAAAAPALRHLSLLGNPACPNALQRGVGTPRLYHDYRVFLAARLPRLCSLDFIQVTEEERAEGRRLYGGGGSGSGSILPSSAVAVALPSVASARLDAAAAAAQKRQKQEQQAKKKQKPADDDDDDDDWTSDEEEEDDVGRRK